MEENVIETTNVFGAPVYCTATQWYAHIVAGHPMMAGKEARVSNAVSDPNWVYRSYSHPNDRDVYFKYESDDNEYTKVVVQYSSSESIIVSAWPQATISGKLGGLKYVRPKLR